MDFRIISLIRCNIAVVSAISGGFTIKYETNLIRFRLAKLSLVCRKVIADPGDDMQEIDRNLKAVSDILEKFGE